MAVFQSRQELKLLNICPAFWIKVQPLFWKDGQPFYYAKDAIPFIPFKRQCQYIFGDVKLKFWQYCSNTALPNKPYCKQHYLSTHRRQKP